MARIVESNFKNPLDQGKLMQEISRVAYELYEKRGRTPGKEWNDWFEAEKLVRSRLEVKNKR